MPTGVYPRTKTHNENISKSLTGNPNTYHFPKGNQWRFKKGEKRWTGRKHTEESKKKMSESAKGKVFTEEHRKHLSEARIRGNYKGERSPKWKGGIKRDYHLIKLEKIAGRKKPQECEICGAIGKICFDHDHDTSEFRGWICARCNLILGQVKDNSELLIALVKYLIKQNPAR